MNPSRPSNPTSSGTPDAGSDPSARRAKRLLWALVLGITVVNLVLFLSTCSGRPAPSLEVTATNQLASPETPPP